MTRLIKVIIFTAYNGKYEYKVKVKLNLKITLYLIWISE